MNADRETLGEPDPIDGLVDRGQQPGRRSAGTVLDKDAPGHAVYLSLKGLVWYPISVIFTVLPGLIARSWVSLKYAAIQNELESTKARS